MKGIWHLFTPRVWSVLAFTVVLSFPADAQPASPGNPSVSQELFGLRKSQSFFEMKDYSGAVFMLKTEERRFPDDPTINFNLGQAYEGLGKREEAEANYRLAIRKTPGYSAPYLRLGIILLRRGALSEARANLEKYVKMEPKDASGWTALAAANLADDDENDLEKRLKRTREALGKALGLNPKFPGLTRLYFGLACLELREGREDAAEKSLVVASESADPEIKAKALLYRAGLALNDGKRAAGEKLLRAAYETRPDLAEIPELAARAGVELR